MKKTLATRAAVSSLAALLLLNVAAARDPKGEANPDPYPSTYQPPESPPVAIVNATVLTAAGPRIDGGTVLMAQGRIVAVGTSVSIPSGARVIDAKGRWVTPGIVDPHAHIGMMPSPRSANGGEIPGAGAPSDSNDAGLWIEHSIWPQDPMFERAAEAGVTTLEILPGSAKLFNGRTVVLKNVPAVSVQGMKFPGAPYGLKMACGENPQRSTGRAGNMAGYRSAFISAASYARHWDDYHRKLAAGQPAEAPGRDLTLETLAGVLRGEILVQIHCYRADDMLQMIDLSKEFGFHIAAFHHALEKVAVVTWAGDWSGYKMEAYDAIMENAAFVDRAGGIASMHSDDPELLQHLNAEAARVMTAAQHTGLAVTREDAIKWLTINPATIIGVGARTGSLEPGKMADVVLWSTDPFSVYALADLVFIDGAPVYDRAAPRGPPRSDFELGLVHRRQRS